jgi:PKD repeat protein
MKKLFKSKLVALFILLFYLVYPLVAKKLFVPLTLTSKYDTYINFSEVFVCKGYNNCQDPYIKPIKLYDFNKVGNCFKDYNRKDIDICVSQGSISPYNIHLNAGETKRFVIETDVPEINSYHIYFFIFSSNTEHKFQEYYRKSIDMSKYSYINEVYYYFHGYYDYAHRTLDRHDLNGKGVVIGNFDLKNEVEVHMPLLVNLPIGIDSAICTDFKLKLNEKLENKYIPENYLNMFFTLPLEVYLNVIDNENNKLIKSFKDIVYVDVRRCENNYHKSFTIDEPGIYKINLNANLIEKRVKNSKSDSVSAEVKVYDPNQRFCYTNIRNVKILGGNDHVVYDNEDLIVIFEIMSGENDGTGNIESKSSFWKVELDGNKIKYGQTENSLSYKKITVNFGKVKAGEHSLKIEGYALNCDYNDNRKTIITKNIRVLQHEEENRAPSVTLSVNPTEGKKPLTVNYEIKATDPDDKFLTVEIDYEGDGRVDVKKQIFSGEKVTGQHTYDNSGTYSFTVVVRDQHNSVVKKQTIKVYEDEENQKITLEIENFNYTWEDLNKDNKINVGEIVHFHIKVNSSIKYNLTLKITKKENVVFLKEFHNLSPGEKEYNIDYKTNESGNFTAEVYLKGDDHINYKILNFEVVNLVNENNSSSDSSNKNKKEEKENKPKLDEVSLKLVELKEKNSVEEENIKNEEETSLLEKYKNEIFSNSLEKTPKEEPKEEKKEEKSINYEEPILTENPIYYTQNTNKTKLYTYVAAAELLSLLLLLGIYLLK